MKQPKHRYLLRKYVYAENAEQAVRLDKNTPVQDVIRQEDRQESVNTEAIGFEVEGD